MFQPPFVNIIDPTATRLRSVDNGFVFLGKEDTDPTIQANQIPVYYIDENGTKQQLSQPIQLNGSGVPVLSKSSGTVINPIFYADVVSIVIQYKSRKTCYSDKNYPALNDYFTHLFSASGYSYQGQWLPGIQIPKKSDRVDGYALWEPKSGKIIVPIKDESFTTGATIQDDINNKLFSYALSLTSENIFNVTGFVDAGSFGASVNSADNYAAIQKALDSGMNVSLRDGEYNVTGGTLKYTVNGQEIRGAGYEKTILKTSGTNTILAAEFNYNSLSDIQVKGSNNGSNQHGVHVGKVTGSGGSRFTFNRVLTRSNGGDGIRVSDGNLGVFNDVISISNTGHGINFTSENNDNNAWSSSGRLDLRGNGGDGLHLNEGGGASAGNAPKSHMFPSVSAQENGGYGVYIGTRSSCFWIYSENNSSGSVYVANGSGAEGNWIVMIEGNSPVYEVPIDPNSDITASANFVLNNNFDNRYARAFENLLLDRQLTIESPEVAGKWKFYIDPTTPRKINLQGYGSGGSGWTLDVRAGASIGDNSGALLLIDRVKTKLESNVTTIANGDTSPLISSNSLLCNNSTSTTITFFDGRSAGLTFSLQFDGNTTIANNSNIKLKSGSSETPTNNSVKKFVCNMKNVAPYFIEV